jgi:Ca2+-binding RTX toxin-like protein
MLAPTIHNREQEIMAKHPLKKFVFGTPDDDSLEGTNAHDIMFGFDGDDAIFAQGGNDIVFGGRGSDLIRGGAGHGRDYYQALLAHRKGY